jgi:hypothetical protein
MTGNFVYEMIYHLNPTGMVLDAFRISLSLEKNIQFTEIK